MNLIIIFSCIIHFFFVSLSPSTNLNRVGQIRELEKASAMLPSFLESYKDLCYLSKGSVYIPNISMVNKPSTIFVMWRKLDATPEHISVMRISQRRLVLESQRVNAQVAKQGKRVTTHTGSYPVFTN